MTKVPMIGGALICLGSLILLDLAILIGWAAYVKSWPDLPFGTLLSSSFVGVFWAADIATGGWDCGEDVGVSYGILSCACVAQVLALTWVAV